MRLRRRAAILAICLGVGVGSNWHTAQAATSLVVCNGAAQHAAVVVEHDDGTIRTACVGVMGASINGSALLGASGISFGPGSAELCQVDGEPSSYPDPCLIANLPYWQILIAKPGGAWTAANFGITSPNLIIADGGALGFHYVSQSATSDMPPTPWGTASVTKATSPTTVTTGHTAAPRAPDLLAHSAPPAATNSASASAAPTLSTTLTAAKAPPAAPGATINATGLLGTGAIGGLLGLLALQILRARRSADAVPE